MSFCTLAVSRLVVKAITQSGLFHDSTVKLGHLNSSYREYICLHALVEKGNVMIQRTGNQATQSALGRFDCDSPLPTIRGDIGFGTLVQVTCPPPTFPPSGSKY